MGRSWTGSESAEWRSSDRAETVFTLDVAETPDSRGRETPNGCDGSLTRTHSFEHPPHGRPARR